MFSSFLAVLVGLFLLTGGALTNLFGTGAA